MVRTYGRIGDVYFNVGEREDGTYEPQVATRRQLLTLQPEWKVAGPPHTLRKDAWVAAFKLAQNVNIQRNG